MVWHKWAIIGVQIQDNYAYVIDGNGLVIIDVSNPANPGEVAF